MASSTTSIRLPDEIRSSLESASRRMSKGKNWIIKQALKEYLDRHSQDQLRSEARRQSLLASKRKWKDEKLWEHAAAEVWDAE